jgi:hypothetical protein
MLRCFALRVAQWGALDNLGPHLDAFDDVAHLREEGCLAVIAPPAFTAVKVDEMTPPPLGQRMPFARRLNRSPNRNLLCHASLPGARKQTCTERRVPLGAHTCARTLTQLKTSPLTQNKTDRTKPNRILTPKRRVRNNRSHKMVSDCGQAVANSQNRCPNASAGTTATPLVEKIQSLIRR